MASLHSSSIRFLALSGEPIALPLEWAACLIEVDVERSAWESASLSIQGQPAALMLKAVGGRTLVLAEWPRANPGNYHLRLVVGDRVEERAITVLPRKINAEAFEVMLEDLAFRLPGAIALGFQRAGALAGLRLLPPEETTLAQEVVRLRRAVLGGEEAGLAEILEQVGDRPHSVLRNLETWVKREKARFPHPARLGQALARGYGLDERGMPLQVVDRRVESTFDVYENRLLKTFLSVVAGRLRRLQVILSRGEHQDLLPEVEDLLARLTRASRRARFLEDVSHLAQPPDQVTMVLLKEPPYRAAMEAYLAFQKRLAVQLEDTAMEAPLKNTPYLYEVWGSLEVLSALTEAAAIRGYRLSQQRLFKRTEATLTLQYLPGDSPLAEWRHPDHDTVVRLFGQRTYEDQGHFRSMSFPQRPDVAIEVCPPSGESQIFIFDPKYKLDSEKQGAEDADGTPKKDDIDKMHAYRDAIRRANGSLAVTFAAVLYPGSDRCFGAGLAAFQAYPGKGHQLMHGLQAALQHGLSEIEEGEQRCAPPSLGVE
jgi:hypothetical protein